jgi:hypothetical protein
MSSLSTDTKRMRKDGEELKILARKYNKTIFNFQSSFTNMDCWSGDDANVYRKDVLANCDIYEQIGDVLFQYANYLIKEAERLEKFEKENFL